MKTIKTPAAAPPCPSDDEVRMFAWLIYEHTGRLPGRDLANWFEAKAWLSAVRGCREPLQLRRTARPPASA